MMRFINTLLTLIQAGDHLRHMGRREQLASDRSFASTHVADGGVPHETQDDWVASALDDFLALNNPNDRHRGFNTEGYGVYVGAASDELVFLDTDKPSFVFYGPSRTGKFATNQAFQAANTTDRSAIFNDPKGEFFERTVEHRAAFQDDRVYAINPDPDLGIPSVGFNPMGYIPKRAAAGENIDSDVREVIGAVFSTPAKIKEGYTKEDHWTVSQAKDFYFCYTTAFAYLDPVRVTLGGLYDFAHLKDEDFWTLMSLWAMHPGVSPTCRQKATVLIDEFVSCNVRMDKKGKPIIGEDGHPIRDWDYKHSRAKQYLGNIRERMQAAVAAYSPGSPFRGITDQTDFDVTILARQPSTLYIVVPDRYMELGERWST